MTTEEFIAANADGDVNRLAFLRDRYPDVDMAYALDQIAGRQTARRKLPSWAAMDGIVYPPHLSMEQCSSELTARYKAAVAHAAVAEVGARLSGDDSLMVDLTGGFGVDFSFVSRGFSRAVYVERNPRLCDIARHNFVLLGMDNVRVVCGESLAVLRSMSEKVSLIFLDPARRDSYGGKTVAISDCTPDVLAMRDELLARSSVVVLKLSPMLDWHKAVADLGQCVSAVHIVSAEGECKELLLVLRSGMGTERPTVVCADCTAGRRFVIRPGQQGKSCPIVSLDTGAPLWLHIPDASVMKSGCFGALAAVFGVEALSRNSHVFFSHSPVDGFPVRSFCVTAVATRNKKDLRKAFAGIDRANVAVRNFPMSAEALRSRLKLRDGGDVYVFASSDNNGRKLLFITRKD